MDTIQIKSFYLIEKGKCLIEFQRLQTKEGKNTQKCFNSSAEQR